MDAAWSLMSTVERFIDEESLLEAGDGVVVAVSGGPDSVALLHLLFALSERHRWRLSVAHVNHGFRGREADEEAEFVRELAASLRLPFYLKVLDMPGYLAGTKANAQAAARALRYAFLREAAREAGAGRIALAHHADDQAETVLMRLLRGTGPSGLAGIPLRRSETEDLELVRPLLRIYKAELIRYCEQRGLTFRTDSSNLETKYFRNQIRLEVLPYLSRYQDRLPESLNRLAILAAEEDDLLTQQTRALFEQFVNAENGSVAWSAQWFGGVHVALQRRLIKLILSYLALDPDSVDYHQIEQLRNAVLQTKAGSVRMDVDSRLTFRREYDRVMIHRMVLPPPPYAYHVSEGQTELFIPETGARMVFRWLEPDDPMPSVLGVREAVFDVMDMSFPLSVRSRQTGDRMSPLGLNGSKKVKDMFIDAKVPPYLRERTPVVTDAEGRILWLPGVRRSAQALVREDGRRKLHIEWQCDFN
ncbi:tRNA lysidine(34) synthetase TilS [Paenibacillus validus]|uniref:tRNA lysidine(34) synthetase TilS n=1 Tax=Paenibacillus TaxID=44249 RepID=UPI000FDA77FD|nr:MULTISPECIES: tRNA lysidine(34) synthetase TilS [Paenibacillus]MED4601870.1 tRNA lysidine(34) synthetase TilS [Paenibacillus validus]MED4608705.1 tRNA lysidine(34) synthetase TilS [Paenibacillus validus]